MKHREFWIDETDSHDGDLPIAFKEHPGQGPLLWQSSLIHVIEYAAYEELEAENARLIRTLKKAYKKHVQDDPRIGWNELGDILMSTLCDSIGDDEFVKFCEQE